ADADSMAGYLVDDLGDTLRNPVRDRSHNALRRFRRPFERPLCLLLCVARRTGRSLPCPTSGSPTHTTGISAGLANRLRAATHRGLRGRKHAPQGTSPMRPSLGLLSAL